MRMEVFVSKPLKKPKNLSLEPSAIARGERYARLHGTSLSSLVSDYLAALPLGSPGAIQSPAVRRLYGSAAAKRGRREPGRAEYRDHLARKHGVA